MARIGRYGPDTARGIQRDASKSTRLDRGQGVFYVSYQALIWINYMMFRLFSS